MAEGIAVLAATTGKALGASSDGRGAVPIRWLHLKKGAAMVAVHEHAPRSLAAVHSPSAIPLPRGTFERKIGEKNSLRRLAVQVVHPSPQPRAQP